MSQLLLNHHRKLAFAVAETSNNLNAYLCMVEAHQALLKCTNACMQCKAVLALQKLSSTSFALFHSDMQTLAKVEISVALQHLIRPGKRSCTACQAKALHLPGFCQAPSWALPGTTAIAGQVDGQIDGQADGQVDGQWMSAGQDGG